MLQVGHFTQWVSGILHRVCREIRNPTAHGLASLWNSFEISTAPCAILQRFPQAMCLSRARCLLDCAEKGQKKPPARRPRVLTTLRGWCRGLLAPADSQGVGDLPGLPLRERELARGRGLGRGGRRAGRLRSAVVLGRDAWKSRHLLRRKSGPQSSVPRGTFRWPCAYPARNPAYLRRKRAKKNPGR